MSICSINGCGKKLSTMGWCRMHYIRWYRHGDPMMNLNTSPDTFWDKVDKSGDCWIWTGGKTPYGYGNTVKNGVRQAHRISYTLTYGEIPDGLFICHKCDNPPCVNPDHLFLGTHADNMADSARKGRAHKLHKNDVERILDILRCGVKQQPIADYFMVDRRTISKVKNNKYWRTSSQY